MAVKNFFRELAIQQAKKQAVVVDAITEESPILAMMPMQPATHGLVNVYENLIKIKGVEMIDLDDELPDVYVDSELEQTDLSVLGGSMFVGVDKARKFGGAEAYFNSKVPFVMRESAMRMEKALYYGNLRKFAIDNGNIIDCQGSNNKNYSMVVMKWTAGENTGLYDPEGFGNGKILETYALWGGGVGKKTLNGKEISVYGADIKTYLGIQLANPGYTSAAVNIEIGEDGKPTITEAQVSQLLRMARASAGNTFIYCAPALKDALMIYKANKLGMTVVDRDLNLIFDSWNGVPIITSYNIENEEANVTA